MNTGIPQKSLKTLPQEADDQESELGTIHILDKRSKSATQFASSIAARAEQANHALKAPRARTLSMGDLRNG